MNLSPISWWPSPNSPTSISSVSPDSRQLKISKRVWARPSGPSGETAIFRVKAKEYGLRGKRTVRRGKWTVQSTESGRSLGKVSGWMIESRRTGMLKSVRSKRQKSVRSKSLKNGRSKRHKVGGQLNCSLFTFTSTQRSRVLDFFVQHLPIRVKFLKMKFLAFYRKIVQGEIKELTSHDE